MFLQGNKNRFLQEIGFGFTETALLLKDHKNKEGV